IIEGVTEYFTRQLKDDPDRAESYKDERNWVEEMVRSTRITEAKLRSAYFRGDDAAAVMRLIAAFAAEKRRLAALAPKEPDWFKLANLAKRLSIRKDVAKLPDAMKAELKSLTDAQVDQLPDHVPGIDRVVMQKVKAWRQNP